MKKKYDVIVVGAGLGGLSAATLLAKNGLDVLLLEKHNVPGGYATSFVRGRYEFEAALHEMSGIGDPKKNPGPNFRYLERLGVARRVEFLKVPELFRSIFPEVDITLPEGQEAFETRLTDRFPKEADGIRAFLGTCFNLFDELNEIQKIVSKGMPGLGFFLGAPVRYPTAMRGLPATLGQMLNRHVKDPAARGVLSQYWGYFGLPPSRVSFLFYAAGLATYVRLGATYVKGRSHALANAFVDAFEEWGGEARMNCGVKRIVVDNGRVRAVITDCDEEILAGRVIANVNPVTTCRDLIGVERVPSQYFDRLRTTTIAPSSFNVYLGVNRPLHEMGVTGHEIFLNSDLDVESHHAVMSTLEPPKSVVMTYYNSVWPDVSPHGTSMVTLTALMRGEPWYQVEPGEYEAVKERIADAMIEEAEKIAPGLREYAEVVSVSTPITNMRYTGALGGSIYGFDQPPWFSTITRLGHHGPLGGLYFAGAWTNPGGGFEPSIFSGRIAAETLLAAERRQ
ncbi:MAG: NAD(P)/FAD-dependent oxidoreductase [Deltaproteobacteria bacterium]|nr:NAD(P)/FAD-dependent oxidoreductase [Deltaproteobacteria bacterium]